MRFESISLLNIKSKSYTALVGKCCKISGNIRGMLEATGLQKKLHFLVRPGLF